MPFSKRVDWSTKGLVLLRLIELFGFMVDFS